MNIFCLDWLNLHQAFIGMDISNHSLLLLFLNACLLTTLFSSGHGSHHTYAGGRRTCHCANDAACDITSGRCPDGACATSWFGYTCQSELIYQGCYKDNARRPSLRDVNRKLDNDYATNTPQRCAERCTALNYTVAAVQFSSECFCDDDYGKYGMAGNCNRACTGDSNQTCGGGSANSVYQLMYPAVSVQLPGPVRLQTAEPGKGPGELKLKWNRPYNTSDLAVRYYHVRYQFIKHKACPAGEPSGWTDVNPALPGDLYGLKTLSDTILVHSYSQFYVNMAAQLDALENGSKGPLSNVIQGDSSKSSPTGTVTNFLVTSKTATGMTWRWDPPLCSHHNGIFRHYHVVLHQASSETGNLIRNTSTVTFTNLTTYTEYYIYVRFVTDFGPGPVTASHRNFTDESVPGEVSSLDVSGITQQPTHLYVQWSSPSSPNGIITGYNVTWRDKGSPGCSIVETQLQRPDTKLITMQQTTSVYIENVKPYREYEVAVTASTRKGFGISRTGKSATESGASTGPVMGLQLSVVNIASLRAAWKPPACHHRNMPLADLRYTYTVTNLNTSTVIAHNEETRNTSVIITGVRQGFTYSITVRVSGSDSSLGDDDFQTVDEQPASAPVSFQLDGVGMTEQVLSWRTPSAPGGIITSYEVNCTLVSTYTVTTTVGTVTFSNKTAAAVRNITVRPLLPGSRYQCTVAAINGMGLGNKRSLYFTTLPLVPGNPAKVPQVVKREGTTADVVFYPTEFTGGPLFHAIVVTPVAGKRRRRQAKTQQHVKAVYLSPKGDFSLFVFTVGDNSTTCLPWSNISYRNIPLQPGITYTIGHVMFSTGQNITIGNNTVSVNFVAGYAAAPASSPASGPSTGLIAGASVTGLFLLCGVVAAVVLIWMRRRTGKKRKCPKEMPPAVVDESPSSSMNTVEYMNVGERKAQEIEMTGKKSGSNKTASKDKIEQEPTYKSQTDVKGKPKPKRKPLSAKPVAVCPPMSPSPTTDAPQPALPEDQPLYSDPDGPVYGNVDTSIPVANLLARIAEMRENDRKLLHAEFENIPEKVIAYPHMYGADPILKPKNRFNNILPYDNNYVALPKTAAPRSDYINASYIHGRNGGQVEYIAAQAPTSASLEDFWQLLWQEKVSVVVMLARLVENNKNRCHQYWPEEGEALQVGTYRLSLLTETSCLYFTTRRMKAVNSQTGEEREVTQLHYREWPDHGAPAYPAALAQLRLAAFAPSVARPVLVHCSAGVGRTGTLIALDVILKQGDVDGRVDIPATVHWLRTQRMNMIQSKEQYALVWDTVAQHLTVGETNRPSDEFREYVDGLTQQAYIQQFQVLAAMKEREAQDGEAAARLPENRLKNRDPAVLAPNRHRFMMTCPEPGQGDYINAVYVKGFRSADAYLATQTPLPDTQADLWRLVTDGGVATIVMLDTLDPGDKTSPPYWPRQQSKTYGNVKVDLVSSKEDKSVIHREFLVSAHKKAARTVHQLALEGWSRGAGVPGDPGAVKQLVHALTRYLADDAPTLVHCSQGAEKTGLFLALCLLVDRLKDEQQVDVFQAVKNVRMTRPQFIPTLEQYRFLHEVMLSYIAEYDTYANFQ